MKMLAGIVAALALVGVTGARRECRKVKSRTVSTRHGD
jgi:hypothetical protein